MMDLSHLLQGAGELNQFGMPAAFDQQLSQPDWTKYLAMLQAGQEGIPGQQQPMAQPMQMPQMQAPNGGQAQTGVGYRQPTYMMKGLLG